MNNATFNNLCCTLHVYITLSLGTATLSTGGPQGFGVARRKFLVGHFCAFLGNPQMCESTNSEPTNTGGQMQGLYRHPVRFEIVQGQEQHYSKMLYLSGMLSNIEMHYPPIFRIHTPLWCYWELIQSCILQVWLIIVIVDMLWLILFTHQSQN